MAQRDRLGNSLRWRVIGRMEALKSQADVARRPNVNRSVVSRMWQQFLQFENVSRRPGRGRSRVTTEREERYWTLRGRRYHRGTARQLAFHLTAYTGTVISRQTVYRRLRRRGFYCRRPAVFVPVTRIQRRDRLEWCPQHANNGQMFSLQTSPDLVLTTILDEFTSGENLEHDFETQTLWKETDLGFLNNGVSRNSVDYSNSFFMKLYG